MADWFKFYENDLDETRLQYAIAKLPEVVSVWVRTLSECCRHKSDTFRWGSNIELFGFSSRLGITPEKVTRAIELLAEIDYVEIGDNYIKVLKWGAKQSEYCQWKQRHQNNPTPQTRERVRTPSGVSSRRGEENRGDEKRTYSTASRVALVYLREKTGTQFRETDTNLKIIDARLKESGVDIDGVKKMIDRQVLKWKGTDMGEYLRPETLFGETKFDGYYAAREQPVKNETHKSNPAQRVDRSIGTANEGTASQYRGLGRVAKPGNSE